MSVPVVAAGDVILCAHAGVVKPTAVDPRVLVSGRTVLTISSVATVAGCAAPSPPAGSGPCTAVTWVTNSLRVRASGIPLLLMSSVGIAAPNGAPVRVVQASTRVRAL